MEKFMTVLGPMIGPVKVNPEIMIAVAAVLLIGLVISLIKKAMKVAIVLVVIGFLFASFGPVINGVLANNGIVFDDNRLSINVDGRDVSIDLDVVEGFSTTKQDDGNTSLVFKLKDAPEPIVVDVPTPMATIITTILKASYDLISLGSNMATQETTVPVLTE